MKKIDRKAFSKQVLKLDVILSQQFNYISDAKAK